MLDGTDGPHHGVEFQVFVDLGLFAQTRRVDQHKVVAELVEMRLDGVAGRAGHRRDDVALGAQQGVGHRGLAHIGFADDGYAGQIGEGARLRIFLRQEFDDGIEQIARSAAVGRRNAEDLFEAQGVELIDIEHFFAAVDFVDGEQDFLVASAQDIGDFLVVIRDAGLGFHHKEHQVGFLDGEHHLLADFFLKDVVAGTGVATGIDNGKFVATPFAVAIMAVAGHAGRLIDDGLAHPDQTVEQGGLPDVGPSHNGYKAHTAYAFYFNPRPLDTPFQGGLR